jgi:hypothetical protein
MRIGLIDVDGHNYPNLPLMKLAAYHKKLGHEVMWYEPLIHGELPGSQRRPLDRVYMSKVFSFTPDYAPFVYANEVIKGGSGYCIELVNGREIYHKERDVELPYEVEHIYPDYTIYYGRVKNIENTAYGFCSRGCPRGCSFCHVKEKEGSCSHKVADLSEFWHGQKYISLCDPNVLACKDWKDILQQLIDSKASEDFNQGVDIRLMTDEKAEMLKKVKIKQIHFAYDRYEDRDVIEEKFRAFKEITGWDHHKVSVYVLTNFNTTPEQDLTRIMFLRSECDFAPYVMIYDKEHIVQGGFYSHLQRWANRRDLFWKVDSFDDYLPWRKSIEYRNYH